ncbi:hypothetical protein GGI00_006053, partial [Coemansia sp. RSA 2681]
MANPLYSALFPLKYDYHKFADIGRMTGLALDNWPIRRMAVTKTGRVKFFNSQKGYGFVVPDEPIDGNAE